MANNTKNARIQFKHDTAANWAKAVNFIPLAGEIIVYDTDGDTPVKFKIGDGINYVNVLPFASKEEALLYTAQNLTEEQKKQARENIGAGIPQIQADYSQNDETAVDYIKNKPVYIETELETMDTFTFTSDGALGGKFGCAVNFIDNKTSELELGKKYTVVFDGTTYSDLVCYDSGFSSCMLGEYVNLSGDSPDFLEYPFSIADYDDRYRIFTESESGSHNVEILKQIENVYFYEEFIPDSIARVSDIIEYSLSKTGTTITLMGTNDSVSTIEESVTTATDDDVGNVVLESASAITHVDEAVKQEIVSATLASLQTETLTFVLDDGTTVTKEVVVK